MDKPLSWEEQALSDPDALRAFIELCDEVQTNGSYQTVYTRVASIKQTMEWLRGALEKNPNDECWMTVEQERDGVTIFAFHGNGPNSQNKAFFTQMALQLLPVLLRGQLAWCEFMGEMDQNREDLDEEFLSDFMEAGDDTWNPDNWDPMIAGVQG